MAITLYTASVPVFTQFLGNLRHLLTKAQADLDNIEVEGVSGGGLVKVQASAKGRIIGLHIQHFSHEPVPWLRS